MAKKTPQGPKGFHKKCGRNLASDRTMCFKAKPVEASAFGNTALVQGLKGWGITNSSKK